MPGGSDARPRTRPASPRPPSSPRAPLHPPGWRGSSGRTFKGRAFQTPLLAEVAFGVVHRDLCPENLVVEAGGRLLSADNGSLTIGAIEEGPSRVGCRRPMDAAERQAFAEGYGAHADPAPFLHPRRFRIIAVLSNSARVRLGLSRAEAAAVLDRPGGPDLPQPGTARDRA